MPITKIAPGTDITDSWITSITNQANYGQPIAAVRITNTSAPMYTTSGTTELDLSRYALTGLSLTASHYYILRSAQTWIKSVNTDTFDWLIRANTALTGQQVSRTMNAPTLTELNGGFVYDFLFKGDGGHSLTITSLYTSVFRAAGTGTLQVYGSSTDQYRAWCALYDVGDSTNWTDVP